MIGKNITLFCVLIIKKINEICAHKFVTILHLELLLISFGVGISPVSSVIPLTVVTVLYEHSHSFLKEWHVILVTDSSNSFVPGYRNVIF